MKKFYGLILSLLIIIMMFSSCATVLGGKITTCQEKKEGEPRQIRVGYLIADVVCGFVPLGVDFVTRAIYKPCKK